VFAYGGSNHVLLTLFVFAYGGANHVVLTLFVFAYGGVNHVLLTLFVFVYVIGHGWNHHTQKQITLIDMVDTTIGKHK
jgi:hypothetical protein